MNSQVSRTTTSSIVGLILWIGLCFLVAWTGARVSPGIAPSEWYNALNKPGWNPPNWVFGPVWTLLYTLMGIAAWRIWNKFGFREARPALVLFLLQLGLNGLWSQLFFRLQSPGWAFIEIFFLLAAIIITSYLFSKKDKWAFGLMVPYILWVSFAACLNGTIWWIN
ncbi:TspO/MBR family protein [Rhodohalobacter sp. 614A]|uniref:TspO/MBR family protein n=1 Tax=Rhodohalobacter sp. 614A TaxID=2908649 RepID=UPI001F2D7C6C|nr:TspO/MBR family protein [Rhodohalobacter sp. 614A]